MEKREAVAPAVVAAIETYWAATVSPPPRTWRQAMWAFVRTAVLLLMVSGAIYDGSFAGGVLMFLLALPHLYIEVREVMRVNVRWQTANAIMKNHATLAGDRHTLLLSNPILLRQLDDGFLALDDRMRPPRLELVRLFVACGACDRARNAGEMLTMMETFIKLSQ
jgi:hypothetical protein